jgi:hypothetical protein
MKNQARKPIRAIPTMGPMTTPAIHALLSCGGAGIGVGGVGVGVGGVGVGVGVGVDDANHDWSVLRASPSVQERNVPTCWLNSIIAPKISIYATVDHGERIGIPIILIH